MTEIRTAAANLYLSEGKTECSMGNKKVRQTRGMRESDTVECNVRRRMWPAEKRLVSVKEKEVQLSLSAQKNTKCRWTVSETSQSGLERLSQAPTHPY